MKYSWARRNPNGIEVSSKGDSRFSALYAKMPDGRTIEQWYQCDIKGYQPGGRDWKLGKGKPPVYSWTVAQQWELYLSLWRLWALHNLELLKILSTLANSHGVLTDCFATSDINQARALSVILNEWFV